MPHTNGLRQRKERHRRNSQARNVWQPLCDFRQETGRREEKGTKKYEEGQVSLLQIRLYDNWLEYSPLSNYK